MRILLAEDEIEMSNALVTILKHSNYSVDAVYDGQDALDYLTSDVEYDAAILDIMMPKLDGISVVKKLRAAGNNIPILLLTAKSEIDDKVCGLDAGADDYLTKPFAMKELLARVRALTRRVGEVTDNNLTFSDISLDRGTFILKGPKGETQLASKEFQMCEMLLTSPHNVISTEMFMDKIWGYDTETELNVVWVYISTLRKKFAQIGSNVTIKAIRGVGYSLFE